MNFKKKNQEPIGFHFSFAKNTCKSYSRLRYNLTGKIKHADFCDALECIMAVLW